MNVQPACFTAIAIGVVFAAGCGSKPPAKDPTSADAPGAGASAAATDRPTPPSKDTVPNTPTATSVRISDEILKACGIAEPKAFFAFDSANLRPQDGEPLAEVARCFSAGPLKGRALKLVGHADPRGDAEYNVTLGLSRADSVGKFVTGKGLDKSKISTTSRGAMDATGTDEESWARDRRVDVLLAP